MQQKPSIPVEPAFATEPQAVVGGNKSGGAWRSVASTIGILIAAPLVALLLTAFIFQSYQVDGQSMETSLQNNDRLIIWKVPRTIARVTNHTYVPHRDDVIVFVKHGLYEAGGNQEKQLIKRVIGLPGDHVRVQDGYITVYNPERRTRVLLARTVGRAGSGSTQP